MADQVIATLKSGVLTLTLNRPDKLNCIDQNVLRRLEEQVDRAQRDESVRALVFTGAGERAFSSGADLKAFRALNAEASRQWIMGGNRLFNKIEQLPKPTVAVVSGYALGGGLELALACDFRIGTESTMLACPELQHGWLPGWGGMTRLRRLIGEAKAKEVVLLGQKISGSEAHRLGLLTRVVLTEQQEEATEKLLDHLLAVPSSVMALAKAVLSDEHRTTTGADLLFDVLALPTEDH